jgi:hypothetical protein
MGPSKRPRMGLSPASSSAKGDDLGTSTAGMPLVRMEGGEPQEHQGGPGVFVLPNPWDAGSARMLAGLGFRALATSRCVCGRSAAEDREARIT